MVPKGWRVLSLSEVTKEKISYGIVQAGPHIENGMPYIKSSNVGGKIKIEDLQKTSLEIHHKYRRSAVHPNDIVFSLRGNIGRTSIVPPELLEANLTQGTARISVNTKNETNFVYYSLASIPILNKINSLSKGSTFKEISLEELRKVKLPVPPLLEQQKIANILSTWDKAIGTTERLIDNSTQQKKALMQQLLTGKKRLLDDAGERFAGDWESVGFGDCIEHKGGTALEKHVMEYAKYHFISIGNYSVDGQYIDKGQRIQLNDRTESKLLDKNDLVMVLNDKTKTGDIIGSTILIDEDDKYIYNQRSERIVCNDGINTLFFWFLLNSKPIRTEVFGLSQGGTQIYVNFGALKSIILNLPNLKEQQKIATVLTNADQEIDLLTQQLADLQQEKKALMQVLLTGKRRVVVDSPS